MEPIFGNLIHHYGLRRMNVRGQAGPHKTMLLTAVAHNLKKLLKYRPTRQLSLAVALPRPLLAANRRAGRQSRHSEVPTQALAKPLTSNRGSTRVGTESISKGNLNGWASRKMGVLRGSTRSFAITSF